MSSDAMDEVAVAAMVFIDLIRDNEKRNALDPMEEIEASLFNDEQEALHALEAAIRRARPRPLTASDKRANL